jgi:hypothetical protein
MRPFYAQLYLAHMGMLDAAITKLAVTGNLEDGFRVKLQSQFRDVVQAHAALGLPASKVTAEK